MKIFGNTNTYNFMTSCEWCFIDYVTDFSSMWFPFRIPFASIASLIEVLIMTFLYQHSVDVMWWCRTNAPISICVIHEIIIKISTQATNLSLEHRWSIIEPSSHHIECFERHIEETIAIEYKIHPVLHRSVIAGWIRSLCHTHCPSSEAGDWQQPWQTFSMNHTIVQPSNKLRF